MRKFWNWARDGDTGQRVLRMDGVIADETWFGDETTPKAFRADLYAGSGPIILWLNSPGGDCFAASEIYTMLMEYPGDVTVKIDALAASAASVIAMAGTQVLMAPTATMMIHNPLTVAIGDSEEMKKAIRMLTEIKEALITAYEIKTGLPRAKISALMDAETWLSAGKAVEMKFADGVLYASTQAESDEQAPAAQASFMFSRMAAANALMRKLQPKATEEPSPTGTPVADLDKRLALLM